MYKKNNLFNLGVGSRRLSGEPLVPWSLSDVNLSTVGKHKELFLPGFLCPVNLPFVWGKITKALPGHSRQEGFGKKLCSWMGQHFVISYQSAVLVLYCQAIWKSPGLMCLFSCRRKGSWEYLSSFPCAELRLSDTFRVTQKMCYGVRSWSLILGQAAATGLFCHVGLCKRSSANSLSSISSSVSSMLSWEALYSLAMRTFDGYILCFSTNTSRSVFARKRARLPFLLEMKN